MTSLGFATPAAARVRSEDGTIMEEFLVTRTKSGDGDGEAEREMREEGGECCAQGVMVEVVWCRRSEVADLLRAFISSDKNISPSNTELRVRFLSSSSEWLADRSRSGMARFLSACGSGVMAGVRVAGCSVVAESLRRLLRVSDGVSSPPFSCSVPGARAEDDLRVRQEMGSNAGGKLCPGSSCTRVRSGGARVVFGPAAGCFTPFLCDRRIVQKQKRVSKRVST